MGCACIDAMICYVETGFYLHVLKSMFNPFRSPRTRKTKRKAKKDREAWEISKQEKYIDFAQNINLWKWKIYTEKCCKNGKLFFIFLKKRTFIENSIKMRNICFSISFCFWCFSFFFEFSLLCFGSIRKRGKSCSLTS